MNKLKIKIKKDSVIKLSSSIFAILLGLLIGLLILIISNPQNALKGFITILSGGFNGGLKGIGNVFSLATPVIMTGLAVGFAFKTGLFNIGASGQLIVGAYCGIYVSVTFTSLPPGIHWILALLAAMAGGALWGFIPGIFRAYFNVNEVIATIMMNYIGMYLVNYMVKETVYNSLKNQSKDPIAVIPKWGMDKLFPGSSINGGIFIAIGVAILIFILLNKTTFGYELKACGFNMDAAKYAGINSARGILTSMTISGALAGIGGGLLYLAKTGKSIEVVDILAAEGFAGIPVALLGLSNPIGIVLSALFISHITQGGFQAQIHGFKPEIITIMTSVVIYFSAFALIVKGLINKIGERRNKSPGTIIPAAPVPEIVPDSSSRTAGNEGEVKSDE